VIARLEIEHIIPLAMGGTDEESNLWLACPICNAHKSAALVPLRYAFKELSATDFVFIML